MKKGQNVIVDAITKDLQINAVHMNVAQEYIMITEDKAYRCLTEWKMRIERRDSWIAPVSLLASILLAFVTADFRDAFGMPKETWRAVYVIGAVGAGIWTIRALIEMVKTRGNIHNIEDLINVLKKGAVMQKTTLDSVQAEATTLKTSSERRADK